MSEPHQPVGAIFDAVIELPPERRAAYLDEACGGDDSLRQRVEALLRAHEAAELFMDRPAVDLRRETVVVKPVEQPGDRIGRYKLLQQIGEGGCGVVYMAEQEEPVHRRVALKVIKLGMDTKSVIARFDAERQALALMDHPNIAKVLDAGATDAGRPYFVMELVRGVKITDFCDQNNVPTEDRLKLFIQVCQAIQHAHQKGIIHRDIKPSNILVTVNDGVPVPKVIDFGIAKATQGRLTDQTLFTAFEQFIGTPAYMSPEQAVLTSLDIDTRSDIYSLGVLLYELLTGRTPFDQTELLAAGLDEMRRTIREKEPLKPSTRLTQELVAADVRRRTSGEPEPSASLPRRLHELIHALRGDLDWIVMKALEKDRTRRYETANGLAMDITRHLNCEPVLARPPSRLYELQKTVRRHKVGFAATGAVIVALLIGLSVSTWLLVRETADRQRAVAAENKAQTEASKSRQVAQFLTGMLAGVGPSAALGRDTTMLREILDKTAERVGKDLTNQPEVEMELRTTLARTYQELALYRQMEEMARDSLQLARSPLGEDNVAVAQALDLLGTAQWHLGKNDQAGKLFRESLAMRRKLLGNEHPAVAESLQNLALVLRDQGQPAEAETLYREALAIDRKLLGNESPDVAGLLSNLANVLRDQGKLVEAETMHREALAIDRKRLGNEHPAVARSLDDLGGVLNDQGKLAEAESCLREALAMQRKLLGNEHPDVARSLFHLAYVLGGQDKLAEAESIAREALAIDRKRLGSEHPDVADPLNSLAGVLSAQGKLAEAETLYREALAIDSKQLGNEHPDTARSLNHLVDVLLSERKFDEAEQPFNGFLTPAFQSQPKSAALLRRRGNLRARTGHWKEAAADLSKVVEFEPDNHEAYHSLAPLLVQSGDLEGYRRLCSQIAARFGGTSDPVIAERMAKDCLLLPPPGADLTTESNWAETAVTIGKNHPYWAFFQFAKGLAEYRQGHFASAGEWMQKVLTQTRQVPFRDVEACMVLAMAQYRSGQMDQARTTVAQGVAIAETKLPKLDNGDLGDDWGDWIIAQALLKEARALIESPSTPVAKPSVPK